MSVYSKPAVFAILSAVVILVGTVVTVFIPLLMPSTQPVSDYVTPYTAIELEGRDIYIREGCNNCHTQTVRPLRTEVLRYGEYSKPEEFAYDRPFLWGSRRTGPDLNRVGGKYPDSWHYKHMQRPQSMFEKSNMPPYAWLAENKLDTRYTVKKISILGYGYTPEEVALQIEEYKAKVTDHSYDSKEAREEVTPEGLQAELTEMDAIIAYMQKLGRDVKKLEAEK
ncbi:cytochrome-c oxidase, cbb3-type subunit II [Prosthecochloris marina]|uniref:Cytochrome-c oxidase, cbb3-type subunit II n=1 Tax=Prosthecochloris marina TaxID=2017681 RepID=A0A317T8N0_9CHLB|nr:MULTISPECIES: cytochrome-c oxidase, cbb3-type subunit II [Prosthecochloris]PWW81791.1 cytochrome-c oxidase, cbb3-type subunit II [Prosthecochloris marina]